MFTNQNDKTNKANKANNASNSRMNNTNDTLNMDENEGIVDRMNIRYILNSPIPEATVVRHPNHNIPSNLGSERSRSNTAPDAIRVRNFLNRFRSGHVLQPGRSNRTIPQQIQPSRPVQGNMPTRTSSFLARSHNSPEQFLRSRTAVRPNGLVNRGHDTSGGSSGNTSSVAVPQKLKAVARPSKGKVVKASKAPRARGNARPQVTPRLRVNNRDVELKVTVNNSNLTEEEIAMNQVIAAPFIEKWNNGRTPSGEWNPSMRGHRLMDLELPSEMLLDCIFDHRHLAQEDIGNIRIHQDPLVELYRTYGRAELMEQTRIQWRLLRSGRETDQFLRYRIDLLSELAHEKKITPFLPLGNFLASWHNWNLLCLKDGAQQHIHKRPIIHRDDTFLTFWGARELQELVKVQLQNVLLLKGVQVIDTQVRLKIVKTQVEMLCKDRKGLTIMLNPEAFEALRLQENTNAAVEPMGQEQVNDSGSDRDAEGETDDEWLA